MRRFKVLEVNVIDHKDQRYPSWADWRYVDVDNHLRIDVSQPVGHNWRHIRLAVIHELLEETVCRHMGITQESVDDFDMDYEKRRVAGERFARCGCVITNDPGSDVHAPYRLAHKYAESVEYGLARVLDVDAKEYDEAFIALDGGVKEHGG